MNALKTRKVDFRILDRPDVPLRTVAAGDLVLRVGEPAREMFLLRKGKVAIQVHGKTVEEIAPGGVFGEMALIDRSPRSANAIALEESQVVPINEALFLTLIQDAPFFALDIMSVLVTRLRAMNKLI